MCVKERTDLNYTHFIPYQEKETLMATATAPDSEIKVKIGKMIFYITAAIGLWFFYWFAGIQCPC